MKTAMPLRPLGKLMMVSAITAGLLLAGNGTSWADRDGRNGWQNHRYEQRDDHRKGDRHDRGYTYRDDHRDRKAVIVRELPRGYRTVVVNKARYYVHDHRYYTRGSGGYVLVSPPIGAFFATLPLGSARITIAGSPYFFAGDVYYRPVPRGYVVTAPPAFYSYRPGGWR